jgi:hypothetical protein
VLTVAVYLYPAATTVALATGFLATRFAWIRANISPTARILVNVRDFNSGWTAHDANRASTGKFDGACCTCLLYKAEHVRFMQQNRVTRLRSPRLLLFKVDGVIDWLARLPPSERILGVLFEDPSGSVLPFVMSNHVARTRSIMDAAGWTDGHLALHVHQGYGLAEASVLEGLASGATGIWCGVTREGAVCGHANSLTTITNLVRIGNARVGSRFNLAQLRRAAVRATVIASGAPPHPMTELYGEHALDVCFDPSGGMSTDDAGGFNAAVAMKVRKATRVSTMASQDMLGEHLTEVFGRPAEPWPSLVLSQMFATINRDLCSGEKLSYDGAEELFALYLRCGGIEQPAMAAVLASHALAVKSDVVSQVRLRDNFPESHITILVLCVLGQFCLRSFA